MLTTQNTAHFGLQDRRRWLQAAVTLPWGWRLLTSPRASRGDDAPAPSRVAKSCILLWLDGGPSHLETFDLKPEAPVEVRGPCRPIATNVPGIALSEWMPRLARHADKLAIVRSVTSPLGEHGLANHYLLTGYKPSPVLQYPSYGAVVANERHDAKSLYPPFVAIPESRGMVGAGFLGTRCEPFVTGGDPSRADFQVRDLRPYAGVDDTRLRRRADFLRRLDTSTETSKNDVAPGFAKAFQMTLSPDAQRTFSLQAEPESIRQAYGPRTFGQSCLLARRLVERGVPFVSVQFPGWDTHEDLALQLRDGYSGAKVGVGLVPTFDQAFSALLADLHDRGLLDQTLVVAMGEFGRTPKVNARGGRDHWPRVFSAVFAGGGIAGGQVIGASDSLGESPRESPITPSDLARTLYFKMGIDGDRELSTPDGRPIPINQGGKRVRELA